MKIAVKENKKAEEELNSHFRADDLLDEYVQWASTSSDSDY